MMNREATGYIDILKDDNSTITICGWGAYKEKSSYIPPDFFVIKNNGKIIAKIKPNHLREDVCKYLNCDVNEMLIYGFSININKNELLISDDDVDRCINVTMQLDNTHIWNLRTHCYENINKSVKVKLEKNSKRIELGFNALYSIAIENVDDNTIKISGTCKFENIDSSFSCPVNYLLLYKDSIYSCYEGNANELNIFNIFLDCREFNNDLKNIYLLAKHPDGYYCELYTKYNSIHYSPLFELNGNQSLLAYSCHEASNGMIFYTNNIAVCCEIGHDVNVGAPILMDKLSERSFKYFKNNIDYKLFMKIFNQRRKLIINALGKGRVRKCFGCHLMKKFIHDKNYYSIQNIRLTQSTVCNLRCSYCSMKINERQGKIEQYNFTNLLYHMFENSDINTNARLFWQGGEPTIQKNFGENIIRFSQKTSSSQIIVSNCVHFIPELVHLLKINKCIILTSIDAGCAETYKIIRGKERFNNVINNIKIYIQYSKNIICQYILLKENMSHDEIFKFLYLMKMIGIEYVLCRYNIFDNEAEQSKYTESYKYFIQTAKKFNINYVYDIENLFNKLSR